MTLPRFAGTLPEYIAYHNHTLLPEIDADVGNGIYIDVTRPAYGADTTGVADSTAAILLAIAAAKLIGAVVFFPPGRYRITSTLFYVGTAGDSIIMQGSGNPRGINLGTQLIWDGAAGGTVVHFKGANNSPIRDLSISGNGIAKYGLIIDYDSVGGVGSSDVSLWNVTIGGCTGTGSACLVMGTSTFQASEIRLYNITIVGYDNPSTTDYGILTSNANAKNFSIHGGGIQNCKKGISWNAGGSTSGTFLIDDVSFSLNTVADIEANITSNLRIVSYSSEGSARMLIGSVATGSPGSVTIEDSYFNSGNVPSDDFIIITNGTPRLFNNDFQNNRTGASVPKIKFVASAGDPGSFVSEQNFYKNATDHAPIYDGSGNDIYSNYTITNASLWRIRSWGDYGGTLGGGSPWLKNWQMGDVDFSRGGSKIATSEIDFLQPSANLSGATPSVAGLTLTNTNNGSATTITNFTGGAAGQLLIVAFIDNFTTIQNNANIVTKSGADITPAAGKAFLFIRESSAWREISGAGAGAAGTVTTVSVTTANGVSGSVATATTTPAITLVLGAITPSSVVTDLIKLGITGAAHGIVNSDDGLYFNTDSDNNGSDGSYHFGTNRTGTSGGIEFLAITDAGVINCPSTTGAFMPNQLTTTQRDAFAPSAGMIIFNVTTSKHQGYNGSTWVDFY